jgi:hypothetical protein
MPATLESQLTQAERDEFSQWADQQNEWNVARELSTSSELSEEIPW